jgi:N-methylhydantoinase B
MNHGLMRAIDIVAPAGSVVHARHPAAVSAMATTTFDVLVACIVGAFSQVVPERAIAASYNLQTFVTSGIDPATGNEFITYAWGPGGWGASRHADGRTAMSIYTTTTTVTPCEAEERRIPFVIEKLEIVPDSGGVGRRRGGNCVRRVVRFDYEGQLTSLAGRGRFPIWGLFGGGAGARQTALLETRDGVRELGLLAEGVALRPGDRLIYTNGGDGGYGPAIEREPQRVLDDVLDGWVTPARAREAYRVALREVPETSLTTTYEIDAEETARLRAVVDAPSP